MKKRSKALTAVKRIILTLIFLAVIGAVFYFGYYQFQLADNTYGVIFTKLNSWDHKLVQPSEFRIEWEGLIPLNLRMEKFTLAPVQATVSAKGELPSSAAYSALLQNSPDFSYEYSFRINYRIKPEGLKQLVTEQFLRSETYPEWISSFNDTLIVEAAALLHKVASDTNLLADISYDQILIGKEFLSVLAEKYPDIDFINVTAVKIIFPDFSLYAEGRRQYFMMEKIHNDFESSALEKTSRKMAEESAKVELLEKYGEIFSKYPVLIDYYRIYSEDGENLIPSIELPVLESSD